MIRKSTLLAAALALTCGGASAQERLRIAGNFGSDHSSSVAMQRFNKDVETASNGALVIDVFDNHQLGGAQENVTRRQAP
jgi:TRAP-type C4-dicarboxylate transport system substrate-binding protein